MIPLNSILYNETWYQKFRNSPISCVVHTPHPRVDEYFGYINQIMGEFSTRVVLVLFKDFMKMNLIFKWLHMQNMLTPLGLFGL